MRVLLVEDSPTDALLTQEAIDSSRFHLTHVDRLGQALDLIHREQFDVVLLDLGLPDSQGLQTFHRFHQIDHDLPVVILSGEDDQQLALQAVSAGAQDYLVKSQIHHGILERSIRYAVERRRIQVSLRQSEARLAEAVRLARLGYWSRDLKTGYVKWSDLLFETFGVNPSEFSHRLDDFLSCVHPEDRAATATRIGQVADSGGEIDHVYRILVRGEVRFVHERGRVFWGRDGSPERVAGTAQDITDRVRAQEALRLRERAIAAASQGIVICDALNPQHPIVYVNPAFERITGYSSSEVLGRNCRFLQGKDTDPVSLSRIRETLKTDSTLTVELLNYRKDGSPFWNELSISPIRDDLGHVTHYVGVQTDVTARRKLEEQLRQSQKMEAIGQLAGGVAHDFNNLLTIINGYSELLLQKLPLSDPTRILLSEIQKAGERSAGLTRQLLAFSRRQVLAPRLLDLNDLIADAEKMLRRVIGEDVQLTTTLKPKLGTIRADPGQLEQVLLNLAVNARDAMPTGGHLTIETNDVDLDESFTQSRVGIRPGRFVQLSVSDTGNGMTDDVKARIFEPFFTTKSAGKGTGLGLATVFGIVQISHGWIDVYSELGIGTTFKIYLPTIEDTSGPPRARSAIHTIPRGSETVLLVEDEDGVRALIRHVLLAAGYQVLEASDGIEGLRIAETHSQPIQLLISDVVLPGLGGRAVAERLQQRFPTLKVLFISGYTDDAVVRHGVLHEAVEFLQKPFTPYALGLKVREVLDRGPTNHATTKPTAAT